MAEQVNIGDAKTRFSKLMARVEKGDEIIIARAGKPIVHIHPFKETVSERKPGSAKGQIILADDFDAPLPEEVLRDFNH